MDACCGENSWIDRRRGRPAIEIDDFLDDLLDAADDLELVAPDFGTSKGKAYEVWVMLDIIAHLLWKGVEVHPHDCDDEVEPFFRVAGSPAGMPSQNSNGAPCHFKLERASTCLELHLGLDHEGVSTSTHEIDLCVLPMPLAYFLRYSGGGPYRGPVRLGLELKAHGGRYKLPHDVPRALLGVAMDLDPCWRVDRWTLHTFLWGGKPPFTGWAETNSP